MDPAPRDQGLPGDFPPYRFLRVLGSGGLGTVYQVEDTQQGLRAAMKVGRPDLDSLARERFHTEVRVLRQLHHPNIAQLYDFGDLPDGRPFLVTEWLEGANLATLLRSGARLQIRDVLLLARSVARGLGWAHQQGILHLDVKPANIWVPERAGTARFDEAKLIDFSVLAKIETDTGRTQAGSIVGTPYYMSPEQMRGLGLTAGADVFSLGLVMYEMLAGRRPFKGKNTAEVFLAIFTQEPPPLEPIIPANVADLVRQCLAKEPRMRPASGVQVAAALELLLESVEDRPLPAPPAVSATEASEITAHGAPGSAPTAQRPLASTVKVAGAIGVALAVLATAVLGLTLSGVLPPSPSSKPADWPPIALGSLLILAGVGMGLAVRWFLAGRRDRLAGSISALLGGARTREALSMTLSLQMDELIEKCQQMDEKFLGLTMALMVKEFDTAKKFDDRQKALMNAVMILEKLEPKLSPWYVRHDKLIASAVSLVGIVSGLATAAQGVAKLVKGTP
jgi:serine/threonine protein kinase